MTVPEDILSDRVTQIHMLKRWQYPWIGLALLSFSLALIGDFYYGMEILILYPVLTGLGILTIVARPETFGYVMIGLGAVSIVLAVLLADWSPVTRGVLLLVGAGALIGGIRSQRSVERKQ